MSFVSTEFIVFALIVIPVYFIIAQRWRLVMLLAASYIFYAGWRAPYLLLIVFSTLVDYFAALGIQRMPKELVSRRRLLLLCSIVANLGVLFVFKYFNLFVMAASAPTAACREAYLSRTLRCALKGLKGT